MYLPRDYEVDAIHFLSFFKEEPTFAEVLFFHIVVESLESSLSYSMKNFIVHEELNYLFYSLSKCVSNVADIIFLGEHS